MLETLNLFLAIVGTAALTYFDVRKRHERDWVPDSRLIPPLCEEISVQTILFVVAYFEIKHLSNSVSILAQNAGLVAWAAAILAHLISHRAMGHHLHSSVEARLAAKKDQIAGEISRLQDGWSILTAAVSTADIPLARAERILVSLEGKPVHQQALLVIRGTGLACVFEILRTRTRSVTHA